MLLSINGRAQLSKRIYSTKLLSDTLVANNNRDFLYNNVNITNLTTDSISLLITITMPEGWTMTTQNILTVSLPPNQNTIVNLRMIPSKSISSDWQKAVVQYRLNQGLETLTDTFRVKVQEFTKFKTRLPLPSIVLGAYQKDLSFPVYVKNTGNVAKEYTISFYNALLNLSYKQQIHLEPSKDTTYKIPLRLTESQWSRMRKEEIKVQVGDGTETVNMSQEVSKIGYALKEHSSAYLDMPLQVEVGATSQGLTSQQYYGGLLGRLDLAPRERLSFNIRSKTYTKGQVIDNDLYQANYEGEKWMAAAGNIQQLSDFVADGYGLSAYRKWGAETNKAGFYALVKSRTGNNQLFSADGSVLVKGRVKLDDVAVVNLDRVNKLNSYMVKQQASMKIRDDMEASLLLGAGLEQTTRATLPAGTKRTQAGTSVGYYYNWSAKYINIVSHMLQNSNSYPGMFKGQRSQNHDIRGVYGRYFAGGFYEANLRKQNVYVDTELISNVFNLKTTNYGARAGASYRPGSITLSVGRQRQQQTDTGSQPIYRYEYVNLNASVNLWQRSYINVNSYYGAGVLEGYEDTSRVPVMSTQGMIQVFWAGASARYDRGPYFYHEYLKYLQRPDTYRRVVLGPYAEANLFRHALTMRVQVNYNWSKPGNTENSNLLGNLVYHNARKGFDFTLTGMVPYKQPAVQPFVTASFRMRIHAPFVPIRKHYNLKMVLFRDENTNGNKDEGEGPISEQMLALNDNLFVSNADGEIIFKNVDKKMYKADFGYTSKIKGWIPSGGTIQTFELTGNKTILIPYKKSKVLSGKLTVVLDKNSNLDFKAGNIKVTATSNDSTRATYSTLTDENGDFYFNLPAGNYTVSLSEVAFDENFRPTEMAQKVDLVNNDEKTLYFEVKQKKRAINIKKK